MTPQFIYTEGPYKEFNGYVFVHGKPVMIIDEATVEALKKRPDFKLYQPAMQAVAKPEKRQTITIRSRAA